MFENLTFRKVEEKKNLLENQEEIELNNQILEEEQRDELFVDNDCNKINFVQLLENFIRMIISFMFP